MPRRHDSNKYDDDDDDGVGVGGGDGAQYDINVTMKMMITTLEKAMVISTVMVR